MLTLKDNNESSLDSLAEQDCSALKRIGNQSLGTLAKSCPELLIFPHSFEDGINDIDDQSIFSIHDKKIKTGNVVGFIGVGNVKVHIHSRFDSGKQQYFLHYMLQKIFGVNILNLPTTTEDESIWDFLLYLFPFCLKKAVRQGLFRTYRTFHYNDDKIKGTIDIPAHIQQNTPFAGRIAYQTRERTTNNYLLHLVHHTIEAVRHHPLAGQLLSENQETRQCVEAIMAATPDFNPHELNKVIQKNLRPVRHPFYTEYTVLQQLCMKILRHERLTYGKDEDEIHGILFDAAWLWEEYLATILCHIGFVHPRVNSRQKTDGLDFYDISKAEDGKGYKGAFPDFYCNKLKLVMDAKYQPLEKRFRKSDNGMREARFQIISYLHIKAAKAGVLLYPTQVCDENHPQWEGVLLGFGGKIGIYGISVPKDCSDFAAFCADMGEKSEAMLTDWISTERNFD